MSIRTRLTLTYATVVAATLATVGILVWWQFGLALRESLEDQLQTRLVGVEAALENEGRAGLQEGDLGDDDVFVAVVSADGSVLDASEAAPTPLPRGAMSAGPEEIAIGGTRYLVQAHALDEGSYLIAGADLAPIGRAQASLAGLMALAGAIAGGLSVIGGWWLAGRALDPVAELTSEADAIGASDLDRRLPEPRRLDELGVLARTLNRMLERRAVGVRRQQAFVAAASHDLRTPLAALQAELELADRVGARVDELRSAIRAARDDAARLAELAGDLLQLATVSGDGREVLRTHVDPGELIDGVIRRVEPIATRAGVSISRTTAGGPISVDRVRVEQALANLLVNAVTYTPSGGEVEVVETSEPDGGEFRIDVLDRGPGIPPSEVDTVFEPFQRGSNARGRGVGLGLATARAAVKAHGGSISAGPREGGGSRFSMRFPTVD